MNYIQKSSKFQQTDTTTITIAAPAQGHYNCLLSMDLVSDTAGTLQVADGDGTVLWAETIAAGGGYEKKWDENNPLRGTEAKSLVISMSGGGAYRINCQGFVHP